MNSGADFAPKDAVPVPAGGFVKRTARTFHYDGVPAGIRQPVIVAVEPVNIEFADSKQPHRGGKCKPAATYTIVLR